MSSANSADGYLFLLMAVIAAAIYIMRLDGFKALGQQSATWAGRNWVPLLVTGLILFGAYQLGWTTLEDAVWRTPALVALGVGAWEWRRGSKK